MTMITLTGGRSFKLLFHAFLLIMLSAHLSPALGFISGVGVGDANKIRCIEGERQALLEFKKGLVDDYGRLSSWQSGDENKNCCNWEGVRCSNLTGHVLELHLSAIQNDGITNPFGGSISSLCKINGQLLAYLDLSNNRLSGRLPNCFMQWPKLIILNLAGNHFFGEVPSSLGSLSVLNTLSLNNNNFSGNLPSSLRNCGSLIVMDMRNNRFSGNVPAWIGESLPSLIFLSLRSNMFNGSIPLHLCWLKDLQILDLSLNDIFGTIPQCLNNFTAMAQKRNNFFEEFIPLSYDNGIMQEYFDSVMVELKRNEYEYHGTNLGLLKIINLSSNKLIGKLPSEIFSLLDLISLNVSRNNMIGEIPQMIGQLKQLESLDLSSNQFSGEIPSSMSEINFLEFLNLSYNNLSGKIPSGTQLQGFDASYFIGNRALCGPPLTQKCPGEETPSQSEATTKDNEENEDELGKWFYVGTEFGFAIGFWGVCSSLVLKRFWRHAYFLLLNNMKDWLYVTITMNIARLQRKIQRQG
ncbi:receptor-like protein EIX2 isoform X2 [Quercus suber]|uniref:receptor-like protein EIX2 isoform X2 n=1 Tax=Quercus suber TaxID=58331 RepID=UPI0032DEA696